MDVTACSRYMAAWRRGRCTEHCGAEHVWQASIHHCVVSGNNCPFCSGHKICSCQSLAAQRPDFIEQGYGATNNVDPRSLGVSSHAKVSWVYSKHGLWVARISDRTRGSGCARCFHVAQRGSSLPGRGLLKNEFPEVYALSHPTLNKDLKDPEALTCGSGKKLHWLCPGDGNMPPGCQHKHAWQTKVSHWCNKNPSGCPFCPGKQVCPCNSMDHKEPGLLRFWHNGKNKKWSLDSVGAQSSLKVSWQHVCSVTGEAHHWDARINGVVRAYRRTPRAPCPICQVHEIKERRKKRLMHMTSPSPCQVDRLC